MVKHQLAHHKLHSNYNHGHYEQHSNEVTKLSNIKKHRTLPYF